MNTIQNYLNNNQVNLNPYPLVNYMVENKIYEKYSSGDYDNYGILLKPFENIQAGSFIKITGLDQNKFQIDYVCGKIPAEVLGLFFAKDCQYFNMFKKIGYTTGTKEIKMEITSTDVSKYQNLDNEIISFDDYLAEWISQLKNNSDKKIKSKEEFIKGWKFIYGDK